MNTAQPSDHAGIQVAGEIDEIPPLPDDATPEHRRDDSLTETPQHPFHPATSCPRKRASIEALASRFNTDARARDTHRITNHQ